MVSVIKEKNIMSVTDKKIQKAWEQAATIRNKNPETWRKDELGNLMRHGSYGTNGEYGWEIDHRKPSSKGGSDDDQNLRALNTEANRKKSDKY